jgi:excisionase family DNA binding protein
MGAAMTRSLSAGGAAPRDPAHRGQTPREQMRFFTVVEVAAFIDVSVRTVRRWIKNGELVAHHFGAAVRIADSDLNAFIARHRDS